MAPANVKKSVPPVATPALPSGAILATWARYTPFQPIAEPPRQKQTMSSIKTLYKLMEISSRDLESPMSTSAG